MPVKSGKLTSPPRKFRFDDYSTDRSVCICILVSQGIQALVLVYTRYTKRYFLARTPGSAFPSPFLVSRAALALYNACLRAFRRLVSARFLRPILAVRRGASSFPRLHAGGCSCLFRLPRSPCRTTSCNVPYSEKLGEREGSDALTSRYSRHGRVSHGSVVSGRTIKIIWYTLGCNVLCIIRVCLKFAANNIFKQIHLSVSTSPPPNQLTGILADNCRKDGLQLPSAWERRSA